MPDSLLFDGVDDRRGYSAGQLAGNGALSVVVILKQTGPASGFDTFYSHNTISGGGLQLNAGNLICYDGANTRTGPAVAADSWRLLAFTKATGSATPLWYMYNYDTSTWTNGSFNGALNNFAAVTTTNWGWEPSECFAGNILIGASWDSVISQATIETLETAKGNWTTAAPDEAWRFDTASAITPFVGTSTQTQSVGATLDAGDAPAGWTDGAGAAPTITPDYSRFPKYKLRRVGY